MFSKKHTYDKIADDYSKLKKLVPAACLKAGITGTANYHLRNKANHYDHRLLENYDYTEKTAKLTISVMKSTGVGASEYGFTFKNDDAKEVLRLEAASELRPVEMQHVQDDTYRYTFTFTSEYTDRSGEYIMIDYDFVGIYPAVDSKTKAKLLKDYLNEMIPGPKSAFDSENATVPDQTCTDQKDSKDDVDPAAGQKSSTSIPQHANDDENTGSTRGQSFGTTTTDIRQRVGASGSSETDSSATSDRKIAVKEALITPGIVTTITYTNSKKQKKCKERVIRLECYDEEKKKLFEYSSSCKAPVFTFIRENGSQSRSERLKKKSKMVFLRDVNHVAIDHNQETDEYEIIVSAIDTADNFKVLFPVPYIAVNFCRYVLDIAHAYSENMIHRSDYVEKFLQSLNEKTVFAQDPNFKEYLENPVYNSMSKINYRAASQSLTAFTLRQLYDFYGDADSFLAFLEDIDDDNDDFVTDNIVDPENKTGFQVLPYQKAETRAETLSLGDDVTLL